MAGKDGSESSDGGSDKMMMKFPMLGETLKGFAIAAETGYFGAIDQEMTPDKLISVLSDSFSTTTRWLGFIKLIIFYQINVKLDATVTVQGALSKDKIKGNILIFGCEDKMPISLDAFSIDVIRSNLEMHSKEDGYSYVQLRNVSLKKDYSSALYDSED